MIITWDEQKNRRNKRKHRLSFELAALVFQDPDHLSRLDHEVEGEQRWQTLGMVSGRILFVAHTVSEKDGEEIFRLISARKATPRERVIYAEGEY